MVAKTKFKMLVEIVGALNSSERFCPVDPFHRPDVKNVSNKSYVTGRQLD